MTTVKDVIRSSFEFVNNLWWIPLTWILDVIYVAVQKLIIFPFFQPVRPCSSLKTTEETQSRSLSLRAMASRNPMERLQSSAQASLACPAQREFAIQQ